MLGVGSALMLLALTHAAARPQVSRYKRGLTRFVMSRPRTPMFVGPSTS